MIQKFKVSDIHKLISLGETNLIGWRRKKNNRIGEQPWAWLKGKEYFYSHYSQEKEVSESEAHRRSNQNEVRKHYANEIESFLNLYKQLCTCIKQYISNYKAIEFDGFDYQKSIARANHFGLIDDDLGVKQVTLKHISFNIISLSPQWQKPDFYWQKFVELEKKRHKREDFARLMNNELVKIANVRKLFPEIDFYAKLCCDVKTDYVIPRIDLAFWLRQAIGYDYDDAHNIFANHPNIQALTDWQLIKARTINLCNEMILNFDKYNTHYASFNKMFAFFGVTANLLNHIQESAKLTFQYYEKRFKENQQRINDLKDKLLDQINRYTNNPIKQRYCRLLDLQDNFTLADLKTAYRKKSMQTHPDKGGSNEAFMEVKKAYDYLANHFAR